MSDRSGRLPYAGMPLRLRSWVERELGSAVLSAITQPRGFSPGVAARLVTGDGRRAFVKAIPADRHAATAELHRYEISAMTAIPSGPMLPRLYGTYDDGNWVALLLEDIDGHHPEPWNERTSHLIGTALDDLAREFTPSPWPDAQRLDEAARVRTNWWSRVDPAGAPGWIREHRAALIEMQDRVVPAATGETLCMRDMQIDNILITGSGRVVFVDWAWASCGAAWIDTMQLACDLVGSGGAERYAEELLDGSEHCRSIDSEAVTAYLANLTGSAYVKARQQHAQPIPALQQWRRSRADALMNWLRHRTGW